MVIGSSWHSQEPSPSASAGRQLRSEPRQASSLPFSQVSTLAETLIAIEQRRYAKLSTLTPNLPVEVAEVVGRALDPNPAARHGCVDDLARAFATACGKPELAMLELPLSR